MNPFFKSKFQEVSFLGIVLLAFIAFYIETDIYTPSFPEMMTYFGANEDSIQMILSMNFFGFCLSSLFFGPASDAYGRKKILCIGLGIFMLSSIGCSVTTNLTMMILFRFLQGLGCGSIVSAGCATIFDVYPPDKSSRLISVLNGTLGGMMALAPIIGNWISLSMGWKANFYLITILAVLSFFCMLLLTNETLPVEKRTKLSLSNVLFNYKSLIINFPFMAHTIIWCLMFSMVIVFIANLSLIFIDYLKVPKEVYGYYQAAIMGAFFVGSMSGAFSIKKLGMLASKIIGSSIYLGGIILLALCSFIPIDSPLILIIAMSLVSLGCALACTIYFSYSMSHIEEHLKGSAMSLTQSLRHLLTSASVWFAANGFDGSTIPMSLIALSSTGICIVCYLLLYKRNQHLVLTMN